jgi:hypothetical protein
MQKIATILFFLITFQIASSTVVCAQSIEKSSRKSTEKNIVISIPTHSAPRIQFGAMYQVNCDPNEIIASAATVNNVQVISSITATHLNQTVTNAQIGI